VLRPEQRPFGIYDVMAHPGPGDLTYPVPWAATAVLKCRRGARPVQEKALERGGVLPSRPKRKPGRDFALAFFADLRAKTAAAGRPTAARPALHVLMGKNHT